MSDLVFVAVVAPHVRNLPVDVSHLMPNASEAQLQLEGHESHLTAKAGHLDSSLAEHRVRHAVDDLPESAALVEAFPYAITGFVG